MIVHLKNITKEEQYSCELYGWFLAGARLIGFDTEQIDKLIDILDCVRCKKCIKVEDISVLKDFMSDMEAICETFFYDYDNTIHQKMVELINKINNEIKED